MQPANLVCLFELPFSIHFLTVSSLALIVCHCLFCLLSIPYSGNEGVRRTDTSILMIINEVPGVGAGRQEKNNQDNLT